MSDVKVVEFIGPPGAGKSTLARLVKDSLQSQGYRCFDTSSTALVLSGKKAPAGVMSRRLRSLHVMLDAIWFLVSGPALPFQVILTASALYSSDRQTPAFALESLKQAYTIARLKQIAQREKCDFIILEEWIIQTVWSMLLGTKNIPEGKIDHLMSTARRCLASNVIICELDSESAYQRIVNRGTGGTRLSKMEKEEAIPLLNDRSPRFRCLAQLARTASGCNVLEVDTRDDSILVRDRIVQFLLRY